MNSVHTLLNVSNAEGVVLHGEVQQVVEVDVALLEGSDNISPVLGIDPATVQRQRISRRLSRWVAAPSHPHLGAKRQQLR